MRPPRLGSGQESRGARRQHVAVQIFKAEQLSRAAGRPATCGVWSVKGQVAETCHFSPKLHPGSDVCE